MTSSTPTLRLERQLLRAGHALVAGMDEVGRGALAGPVSVGVSVVDATTSTVPRGGAGRWAGRRWAGRPMGGRGGSRPRASRGKGSMSARRSWGRAAAGPGPGSAAGLDYKPGGDPHRR